MSADDDAPRARQLRWSLRPALRRPEAGQLLPQGSRLANWFLASLSSRGVSTLARAEAPPLPKVSGGAGAGDARAEAVVHRLCRHLGDSAAERQLRAALLRHHTGMAS